MKTLPILAALIATTAAAFAQGNLTPPGAPAPTMKTLQEIYDRIEAVESKVNTQQATIQSLQSSIAEQGAMLNLLGLINQQELPWIYTTVDNSADVGKYSSLAYSPTTLNPSISYYDSTNGDLKYAEFNGTSWTTSTIDSAGTVGLYTSLAFKSDGKVYIAYYDLTNTALKFASSDGGAWTTITVDDSASVGTYCSLAVSPDGRPHIAYYDATNTRLKMAERSSGVWTVTVVDDNPTDVGKYCSLKFTPGGNPAIAYLDSTVDYLLFSKYSGGSWTKEIVATTVIGHISLAFNASGHAVIAYGDTSFHLMLAKNNGSTWSTSTISTFPVAQDISLAYSHMGKPAISCFYGGPQDLYFFESDGTTWHEDTVANDSITGQYSSLKFTPLGVPAMSYYDQTNGRLKFVTRGLFISE